MIDYTTGKLIRIGTDSRIMDINLKNNNQPRNWDYQKPPNEIKPQFLTGKSKKFGLPHPLNDHEISPFRKIKLYQQPDSRRTLMTEYAPINYTKPLKKKSDINFFTSFNNCEIPKKKRINTCRNDDSNLNIQNENENLTVNYDENQNFNISRNTLVIKKDPRKQNILKLVNKAKIENGEKKFNTID